MNKEKLQGMIEKGMSIRGISRETGKAATTIRFWLGKYELTTKCLKRQVIRRWTDEQMKELLSKSETISDVLRKIGLGIRPGNYDTVRRFIRRNNIDISHMRGKSSGRGGHKVGREVLIRDSDCSRKMVKKMLLALRLLKNECVLCGQSADWNGKPLVMVLDHINGVNNDNRIENLRMLCPNCNSQQETFCGRNKKKSGIA